LAYTTRAQEEGQPQVSIEIETLRQQVRKLARYLFTDFICLFVKGTTDKHQCTGQLFGSQPKQSSKLTNISMFIACSVINLQSQLLRHTELQMAYVSQN